MYINLKFILDTWNRVDLHYSDVQTLCWIMLLCLNLLMGFEENNISIL